ncbi:MAG TPA: hypothetical protein VFG20_21660 [Planctomycetaceae bacterium]|nr:hypothetical protein [Planctomycetaceae bacterium]
MAHTLSDFRDRSELLRRLHLVDTEAIAVAEYWKSTGQGGELDSWRFHPHSPGWDEHLVDYDGPGSLFITASRHAIKIRTGGRWRGFLSMPELRAVHLAAFRAIGRAFDAAAMVLYPDCDDVDGVFWENGTLQECICKLRQVYGDPQPSIDCIPHAIVLETEHTVPQVWYIDSLVGTYFAEFVPGISSE